MKAASLKNVYGYLRVRVRARAGRREARSSGARAARHGSNEMVGRSALPPTTREGPRVARAPRT
eukprot:1661416-Prymnesium_polylepis.3